MDRFASEREEMVQRQLESRGISDKRVLDAMRKVPRHLFVSGTRQARAYWDGPLAIGHYQTISQPYIVALMCEALELTEESDCLEIGSGSGYAAAVLSELGRSVISVERIPELADLARTNLETAGYSDIEVICGDGTLGYSDKAPYDAIAVAAGAPMTPVALKAQLKPGGRLVIPVGQSQACQELLRIRRASDGSFRTENLGSVAFVPLVGEDGW
ncbi:MAG: protein-L-isoaspartate(D-aspartate) O-methyltransferase [Roseibium sp.]|uniref:protein-L-isoaspartate(D-aspartate) O-methyltransferase n=1 Tax=Roseibium sp. TaxID=1936156 RepID=UPI0026278F6E|nr:protein-L-isoaspartate(D-aspartate) O-methyltransferase [Roseibium sp.]MCV0429138.1 protein-L-isoaspartate(D-aspartate) O-methyltransferase [Roseibium sp.]